MASFTDNHKRKWNIEINTNTIRQVRAACGVDLLDAVNGKLIQQLSDDPVLLTEVLYAVCREQAEKDRVTDEEFWRGIAGRSIDDATTALLDALIEFFPKAKAVVLRAAADKIAATTELAKQLAVEKLEGPEIEQAIRKMFEQPISGD